MKNISKTTIWIIVIIIAIFGLIAWSAALQKSDPNTISTKGIHWHPQLHIFVDGEEQVIPENIGLMHGHQPMHTHDEDAGDGVMHLEFDGLVKQNDVRLKQFFTVWGKGFDDFGTLVRMTVNGKESMEYEEYVLQHEDIINLYYETLDSE